MVRTHLAGAARRGDHFFVDTNIAGDGNEEIPKGLWGEFFDGFSRRHRGWLVTVEELIPDVGPLEEARQLPLEGIVADPRRGGVLLLLGSRPEDHVEHRLEEPMRVWVETLAGGAEAALEIESAGGRKTILSFRSPSPVESVDGLARDSPPPPKAPRGARSRFPTERRKKTP